MTPKQKKALFFGVVTCVVCLLFLGAQQWSVWGQMGIPDPDSGVIPMATKDDVTKEDIISIETLRSSDEAHKRKANVLFLVDTSNAMVFSPKGKIPDWDTLLSENGYNSTAARNKANLMTAQCTFGIGGRPATIMSLETTFFGGSKWEKVSSSLAGRDVDSSNNIPGNPDCYYSADPKKPFLLTFINKDLANRTGPSIPSYKPADLMPNDSRMYKMKLIFMRLLQDTETFDKLRFGLATTHVSQLESPGGHIFYRIPDFDATKEYPNGSLYPGFDRPSNKDAKTDKTQKRQWAISSNASKLPVESRTWYTIKRAYLRVPLDDNTPEHRKIFSTLMNGIEDNTPTTDGTGVLGVVDPEITTSGEANLATAIFMANESSSLGDTSMREKLINQKLIYYSHRSKRVTRAQTDGGPDKWGNATQYGRHIFDKGSGEAAGSVIDFFSPPIKDKSFTGTATDENGYTPYDAPIVNFPIRNECDPNWLIILTAGDDVSSPYKSSKAVEHLYHYTKNNKVVRIKDPTKPPTKENLEAVKLSVPIRTLVIGFVDTQDADPKTKALINELKNMADLGWDGKLDGVGKAYFANNVPDLLRALREVLGIVVTDIPDKNVASTRSLIAPTGADAEGIQTSFVPSSVDQWQADIRYYTIKNKVWKEEYSLQKDMADYANRFPTGRRLMAWDSNTKKIRALTFPELKTSQPRSDLSLVSDAFNLSATFPAEGENLASTLMLRWFFGQDYDVSKKISFPRKNVLSDTGNSGYTLMKEIPENRVHSQPGYSSWLRTPGIKGRPKTMFFQSNDGLLHAVDTRILVDTSKPWAREHWAFLPPNVLVGQRLLGLKFRLSQNTNKTPNEWRQTATWINSEFVSSQDFKENRYRSKAGYLTDGSVYIYNLPHYTKPNLPEWKSVLIASMGRGGSGLYALDVTDPTQLKEANFLWAIENNLNYYNTRRTVNSSTQGVGHWGEVHQWSQKGHEVKTYASTGGGVKFSRLGYNAPAPLVGTTLLGDKPTNVVILAGGMQYDLNLEKNGLFGSSLYIFDPLGQELLPKREALSVHKAYENEGVESADTYAVTSLQSPQGTNNPAMGMMLTPPSAIQQNSSSQYLTGYVVADNRGQIFEGSFVTKEGNAFHSDSKKWTLRRIASLRDPSKEQESEANFPIPYVLSLAKEPSGGMWIFGGTADVATRNIGENLFSRSPRVGLIARKKDSTTGRGFSHYLFGFKRDTESVILLRQAKTDGTEERYSKQMTPKGEKIIHAKTLTPLLSNDMVESGVSGWIIPLARSTDKQLREYISAPTSIFNGMLYAATFVPNTPNVTTTSQGCDDVHTTTIVNGESHLYFMHPKTGAGHWPDDLTRTKFATYKGIKITGMTMLTQENETRLYLSVTIVDNDRFNRYITGPSQEKIKFKDNYDYERTDATYHNESLISVADPLKKGASLPKKDAAKMNYWRELFK